MDIEGAEVEVLQDWMQRGLRPRQILVEYDELTVPSARSKVRVEACHASLTDAGYRLIHREAGNFLYVLPEIRFR